MNTAVAAFPFVRPRSQSRLRAGHWLASAALHLAVILGLWQFAGRLEPLAPPLQRIEVPIGWAPEPVAAVVQPSPEAPAAPPEAAPLAEAAATLADPPEPEAPAAPLPEPPPPEAPVAAPPDPPLPPQAPVALPEPPPPPPPPSVKKARAPDPAPVRTRRPVRERAPPPPRVQRPKPAQKAPRESAPDRAVVASAPAPESVTASASASASTDAVAPVASALPSTPPASRAAPRPDPAARQRWLSQLERLMREHKHYPTQARRMRQEGVVLVTVRFSAEGELLHSQVADSSGFRGLDEAALKLVHTAAQLMRAHQAPGELAELRIPIAYELSGS